MLGFINCTFDIRQFFCFILYINCNCNAAQYLLLIMNKQVQNAAILPVIELFTKKACMLYAFVFFHRVVKSDCAECTNTRAETMCLF